MQFLKQETTCYEFDCNEVDGSEKEKEKKNSPKNELCLSVLKSDEADKTLIQVHLE